ncbi:MAG: tyrosine-type recombinase/integrase, partial [Candidatus Pacebacteria bacterium]|nr:tyrosine-type recombinase/integrase [Candidatus Paceibacterota bacterium]
MDILIIAEQFHDHSKFIRGLSKQTLKNYKDVIKFFAKSIEVSDVNEITDKIVREFFIYGRMQRNWKPKTFFSYHKILIVFFRYCITNGYMTYNFAEDIECPKMSKALPKKIPTDDALRLLEIIMNYPFTNNFLRYRNHAIFSTFIYTGLRRSELLNLKVVDVDIENRTIFVRNGKGAKDRILPMSHTLAQRLTRYIQERKKRNKTCPEFFASNNKNKGFTDSGLR